ncbi:MAG TPA: hypothetical protein VMA54_11610 [Steroidobacteraceae bacterium]|jgi:hypothetical protein|nr:hypothetical protein [Steroidobacteraceae bacterium]
MTKSSLAPMALIAALGFAAAGCAQQPQKAQTPAPASAELNVMQVASDMGYNTPKVIDGKTYYCQREELTGSLVPKVACISSDDVIARARAQGDLLKYMASPPNSYSRPGA